MRRSVRGPEARASSGATKRRKPRNQKWSRSARAVASRSWSISNALKLTVSTADGKLPAYQAARIRRRRGTGRGPLAGGTLMKRSFRVWATVGITTIALTVGACGKKPPAAPVPPPAPAPAPPAPEPTKPTPPPAAAPAPPAAPKTPTEDEAFAAMSLDDLNKKAVLTDTF